MTITSNARRIRSRLLCGLCAMGMGLASAPLLAAAEAESWLGLAVTYVDRGYAMDPWPVLELKKVKVASVEPILISRLALTPDFVEWVTEGKTSRMKAHAAQIIATPAALARLGLIDGKSTRKLTEMRFDKLSLTFGEGQFDLPAGEMSFGEDGTLSRIKIVLASKTEFIATPKDGKLLVTIQTPQWRWDVLPAFLFDSVVASGEMSNTELVLNRVGANADGGALSGRVKLTVPDQYVLETDLKMISLRAKDVLAHLQPRHPVVGSLYGSFQLTTRADTFAELGKRFAVSGAYEVRGGSIDRFGLREGMRMASAGSAGGGLTEFQSLSGRFSAGTGKPTLVSIGRMDGGPMQASGSFSLNAEGAIKGWFAGSMRLPTGESSSRRFSLVGTAISPNLMLE